MAYHGSEISLVGLFVPGIAGGVFIEWNIFILIIHGNIWVRCPVTIGFLLRKLSDIIMWIQMYWHNKVELMAFFRNLLPFVNSILAQVLFLCIRIINQWIKSKDLHFICDIYFKIYKKYDFLKISK